ncbi:hypothetical protein a10_05644 [Streptomyces acidiscabies]|nr:hypothetical protein a10_05644 [Streptomyces acidiscabies]
MRPDPAVPLREIRQQGPHQPPFGVFARGPARSEVPGQEQQPPLGVAARVRVRPVPGRRALLLARGHPLRQRLQRRLDGGGEVRPLPGRGGDHLRGDPRGPTAGQREAGAVLVEQEDAGQFAPDALGVGAAAPLAGPHRDQPRREPRERQLACRAHRFGELLGDHQQGLPERGPGLGALLVRGRRELGVLAVDAGERGAPARFPLAGALGVRRLDLVQDGRLAESAPARQHQHRLDARVFGLDGEVFVRPQPDQPGQQPRRLCLEQGTPAMQLSVHHASPQSGGPARKGKDGREVRNRRWRTTTVKRSVPPARRAPKAPAHRPVGHQKAPGPPKWTDPGLCWR